MATRAFTIWLISCAAEHLRMLMLKMRHASCSQLADETLLVLHTTVPAQLSAPLRTAVFTVARAMLAEAHLGQLEQGHPQDGEERQGGERLGRRQLVAQQDVGGEGQDADQRRDGVQDEAATRE